MKFELPKFGLFLIVLGTVGFLAAVIISFTAYSGMDQGALPAVSFLSILIGIAFAFPSLLQDTTGGLSTMRIIVFAVVLLFCTIYLKIGWSIGKMEQFSIDQKWVYILGLAFGSKAFQRFGESEEEKKDVKETKTTEVRKTEKTETAGAPRGKDTTEDVTK